MDYELAGFFLYQGISIRMIFSYINLTLPFAKVLISHPSIYDTL